MRDLLGIEPMTSEEIVRILDTAEAMHEISQREIKRVPTLRGRTVINVFLEPSTRTRVSFEIAAKRLSADAVNVSAEGSSLSKAESLADMVQNLAAMNADVLVVRDRSAVRSGGRVPPTAETASVLAAGACRVRGNNRRQTFERRTPWP